MAGGEAALKNDDEKQETAADDGLPVGGQGDPAHAVLEVENVEHGAKQQRAMLVPFVLVSGYSATELQAEPLLRNAVNVGKPSRPERLLEELRGALQITDPERIAGPEQSGTG